jgi:ribosomal protein S18 acetylase RimI-like enzyme
MISIERYDFAQSTFVADVIAFNALNRVLKRKHVRPFTHKDLANLERDQNVTLVIARTDDKSEPESIVGMGRITCEYTVENGRVGTIGGIAVLDQWGRRGIATNIVEMLLQIASEQKIEMIMLTSHASRKKASGLYQKMGFKCVGSTRVFVLDQEASTENDDT